jgi:uncharacterized membrane protein
MSGRLKWYVLATGLALVLPLTFLATLESENIDNLAYFRTLPSGINDDDETVGIEETLEEKLSGTEEGFLLHEGFTPKYTKIFYPFGARNTDPGGINAAGEIVGTYSDISLRDHCFLLDKGGNYTSFDVPFDTQAFPDCNGINIGGDTVGIYTDGNGNHGWLRTAAGNFYQLDVAVASNTAAYGINKDRDIVGSYYDAQLLAMQGFLLHNGSYSTIHFPGSSSTKAFGINDRGDIVGSYSLFTTPHGFVLHEGKWKTVDVNLPLAVETNKVTGINNRGCMVGVYTSTDISKKHGFKVSLREAGGDGDVPGKSFGTAHMQFHEDGCIQLPNSENFSDPSSGTNFHSTQVTAVTYNDVAHSVMIVGLGTDNAFPVAFTIVAVDSTVVPPGMFSITLSDGYSNSASLLTGTITLR